MEFLFRIVPILITRILSVFDASRLRDKLYEQKHEHELMWTALDDIARMYPDHPSSKLAKTTLNEIATKYGR